MKSRISKQTNYQQGDWTLTRDQNSPTKKSPGLVDLDDEFYQTSKEKLIPHPPQTLPKKKKKKEGKLSNKRKEDSIQFTSVQWLSSIWLFATPWTAAGQASLSITNPKNLHKLMFIELVMPFNHLICCHPLLLLSSILPSIRVLSNESVLRITWPKY